MTTVVRDRPILFSPAMVDAIRRLRKTQTRRVLRPQPPAWVDQMGFDAFCATRKAAGRGTHPTEGRAEWLIKLPFWPGDRLWVRERAWFDREVLDGVGCLRCFNDDGICRFEDGREPGLSPGMGAPHWTPETRAEVLNLNSSLKRRPGIHMPRWASRLTLIVGTVWMQRVQDISTDDAIAEGIDADGGDDEHRNRTTVENFRILWDSINAGRGFGWDVNPWVEVVNFKVAA